MIKTLLLFFVLTVNTLFSFAQVEKTRSYTATSQNLPAATYRLYATQNMWNFIKLNTKNGQMWQVQYSTNVEGRFTTVLNLNPLVPVEKEVIDRFTLYPTQNIYTFILIDQLNGKTWQVQWSTEL